MTYEGICAYSAHWIPITSNPHIDHYIPKSINKSLAYEWSNYRLTCALANTLKKDYEDVVDPFTLNRDSFILDFPSLLVKSNPVLDKEELEKIYKTIIRLKLNDEKFIMDRSRWLSLYCENTNFDFLKRNAPFIAYELERQNLVEKIKRIMSYNPEIWE